MAWVAFDRAANAVGGGGVRRLGSAVARAVVADVAAHLQQVAKIVGVSDDLDRVQRCESDAQAAFGQHATPFTDSRLGKVTGAL